MAKKKKKQYWSNATGTWEKATSKQCATARFSYIAVLVVLLLSHVISFYSRQVTVLIHVAALYIHVAGLVVFFALRRGGEHFLKSLLFWFLEMLYVAGYLLLTYRYTYYDVSGFWLPALALGVAATVALTLATAHFLWKNAKWISRIGWCLLLAAMMSLLFLFTIGHLNYALDTKGPQPCIAVIENKDIEHHRKGPDTYEFRVTVDGKSFDLDVTFVEYYSYEVGETYTFSYYEGAFGKPFYLAE
jgi:hypothetical protein